MDGKKEPKAEKQSDTTITIPLSNYKPVRQRSIDEERKFSLNVNTKYVVINKNAAEEEVGVLIQKREIESQDDRQNYECYIHFQGKDKRWDCWLPENHVLRPHYSAVNKQIQKRMTRQDARERDQKFPQNQPIENDPEITPLEKNHVERTKIRNIDQIVFGPFEINSWYYSPYPEEYGKQKKLYICKKCLKYMKFPETYRRHSQKCTVEQPPGSKIYSDSNVGFLNKTAAAFFKLKTSDRLPPFLQIKEVAVFEVLGAHHKLYCQNLCLLGKLFLDHKTLYYTVHNFRFYVLCEFNNDENGGSYSLAGYFSKEGSYENGNNLACIMVLPPYQRRGYGKFLISLSYYLSQRDGKILGPERPLSDMGKVSYRSFWTDAVLTALKKCKSSQTGSVQEISKITGIDVDDVIDTLKSLDLVKYWNGMYHIQMVSSKVIDDHFRKKKLKQESEDRRAIEFKPGFVIEDALYKI